MLDCDYVVNNYTAKDMVPIQAVERDSFKLLNPLNPTYALPG